MNNKIFNSEEIFISEIIYEKITSLIPLTRNIEKIEFNQQLLKASKLIIYMYKDTKKTNVFLNQIIIYLNYNCILKTIDSKNAFIILFNNGYFSQSFHINRSIFELWAATNFIEKKLKDFFSIRNNSIIMDLATGLFSGSIYPVKLPWGNRSKERPIKIGEMLDELQNKYSNTRKNYSFLCEYCHPNFLYNLNAYLAKFQDVLWQNKLFYKETRNNIRKQLVLLFIGLKGIKKGSENILNLLKKEYEII